MEGHWYHLMGNTYVSRLFTNENDPRVGIDGKHIIPVVTKKNPVTGEEGPITNQDELRAVELYALWKHSVIDLDVETYDQLAETSQDLADKMDPNAFDGWLFLLELDKLAALVALDVIFPAKPPATIAVIWTALSVGTDYANFATSMNRQPDENMMARTIRAALLVEDVDQEVIVQAIKDAGFTDLESYYQAKLFANMASSGLFVYKLGKLSMEGGQFTVTVIKNGIKSTETIKNLSGLVTSAAKLGAGLVIKKSIPVEFNSALKNMMMSNHLHASVGAALANTMAKQRGEIEQIATPAELERSIAALMWEYYNFMDNDYEMLEVYQYYLQEAHDHDPSHGLLFVSQDQIDRLGDLAEDKKDRVDRTLAAMEQITTDLNFTLESGYPDFTSGLNRFSGTGVSPLTGSYLDTFTLYANVVSTSSVPPAIAKVYFNDVAHDMSVVSAETLDGIVYDYRLEYQIGPGLPVGEYPFYFEVSNLLPTSTQYLTVDSNTHHPTISFYSPRPNEKISGIITVQSISLSGEIVQVEYFANGIFFCSDNEPSWMCIWDTNSVGYSGPVVLSATATDSTGAIATTQQTVYVLNDEFNVSPTIEVLTPDGVTAYGHYTIQWKAEDLDDEAYISLYYDTNNSGNDGTLIVKNIPSSLTSKWTHWDISDLPSGNSYYVYAKIDDKHNDPVYDYSPGRLTIASLTGGNNFALVDYELTERTGADMDGVPDAGEPLDLEINIQNISTQEWCANVGTLSATTGGIEITDNEVRYYAPDPGEITDGSGSFEFESIDTFDGTVEFKMKMIYQDCSSLLPYQEEEILSFDLRPDDLTPPTITSGPDVSNLLPDSAVVTWSTDEPADSVVEYGLTSAYGTTLTNLVYTTTHRLMLRGLTGGYPHSFRVSSTDPSGNGPVQATGSLTTPNLGAGYQAELVIHGMVDGANGLTWDGTHLWILFQADFGLYRVYEYDPLSGLVVSQFDATFFTDDSPNVSGIASDGTYLYLIQRSHPEEIAKVTKTGELVEKFEIFIDGPEGFEYGNGSFWVSDDDGYMIRQMDMNGQVLKSFNAPGLATNDVAWNNDHLWAIDGGSNLLYEMDTNGNILSSKPVESFGKGLAFTDPTHFWVSDGSGNGRLAQFALVEDTTSPLISTIPTASSITGSSAAITWGTNEPTDTRIEYGLTDSYGLSNSSDLDDTSHTLILSGLSPNQTYHYRVGAEDMAGNEITWSGDYTFATSAVSNYTVVNSFRMTNSWDFEGITWNGTNLVAPQSGSNYYFTHSPLDGQIVSQIRYEAQIFSPDDVEWANGDIWLTNDSGTESLVRISGTTGNMLQEILLDSSHDGPAGIAWDGSRLWYSDTDSDTIIKVNPSSGVHEFSFPYPLGTSPGGLDYYDGYLWYVDSYSNGQIYKLSTTGSIVEVIDPPSNNPYGITWGNGHMYVGDDSENVIYDINPVSSTDPVVSWVYSSNGIDGQYYEYFQVGSTVTIYVCEQNRWVGLSGTVSITSPGDARSIIDAPLTDQGDGCYYYPWNTAGGTITAVYNVEVRLTDGIHTDNDGLLRNPDLVILLAHRASFDQTASVTDVPNYGVGGFAWMNNDLWVNNYATVDLYYGGSGDRDLTFIPPTGGYSRPTTTEIDWEGSYLYVLNDWSGTQGTPNISRHNASGTYISSLPTNSSAQLEAIAVTGTYIWIADSEKMQVCRYSMSGGTASFCFFVLSEDINGIEWDGTYLWLMDRYGDRLYKYNTSGVEVDRYVCPGCDYLSMKGSQLWSYRGISPGDGLQTYSSITWLPDLSLGNLRTPTTSLAGGTSTTITVTVYADNLSASDVFLRLFDGDPAAGGVQIGVEQVIPNLNPGSPYQTTYTWSSLTFGSHTLFAVVDPAGAIAEADENNNTQTINIQVYDPDPEPPVISNITAVDLTGHVDGVLEDNEQIRLQWDAVDAVTSVTASSLTINGITYLAGAPIGNTYQLILDPLAEGIYPYTIQAIDEWAKIATYNGTLEVKPHALVVDRVEPADGGSAIPTSSRIAVHFQTLLNTDLITTTNLSVTKVGGGSVIGRLEFQTEEKALVFIPLQELENGSVYTATVPAGSAGPLDINNNRLEADFQWVFTTEADTTPPVANLLTGGSTVGNASLNVHSITDPGKIFIYGSALDKNLYRYAVLLGQGNSPTTWEILNRTGWEVDNDYLASWNPASYPNGLYTVRLVVTDTVNLTASQDINIELNIALPQADLSLSMTANPDPVTSGDSLTYELTVSNAGPAPAQSVVVEDTLPDSTSLILATSSQGTCSGMTTVTCNLGDIASGEQATITIQVQVNAPAGSSLVNTASVSTDATDPSPGNNTASQITNVTWVETHFLFLPHIGR